MNSIKDLGDSLIEGVLSPCLSGVRDRPMKKPHSVILGEVLVSPIANCDHQHGRCRVDWSQRAWDRILQVDANSLGGGYRLGINAFGGMCTSGISRDLMVLIPSSGCKL